MNLIKLVEGAISLDEEITKIRSVDLDAPDDKKLKEFCMRMSASGKAIPAAVAGMVYNEMVRTGKNAREVMKEMEERIHE